MDQKDYKNLEVKLKAKIKYFRMIERLISSDDFCEIFERMTKENLSEFETKIFTDEADRYRLEEFLMKYREEGDQILFKMSIDQLRPLASQLYIPFYYRMNKDSLIAEILLARDELYGKSN